MTRAINKQADRYQIAVSAAGISLWLVATANAAVGFELRDQLTFLALMPVIVTVGMFVQHFRLPVGLKFSSDRVTFTLTDAFILLVACWFGIAPAIFLAGIEGFTSSRRTARRLASNLFSSGMMSMAACAGALALNSVLHYGFGEANGSGGTHTLLAASVAILVGSIAQISVNLALFSVLFALRRDSRAIDVVKGFFGVVPMFLPSSAAATLIYYALQHDLKIVLVIGGPIFLAIYFGQRQYRTGVQKRIEVMEQAHRETIEALAVAINAKDEVTHEHVRRVQIYAAGVAKILGCSNAEVEALRAGALLHDIGKIAVPDYILHKPGKLTAAEFEKMKIHTLAGAQILSRVAFPYPIVPVVRHHHERWDGKGYPDGLAGEGIPLTARILTVVDCFDAVREDRQYRKGMTREEAIDLLVRGSGSQYDPHVVGTFIAHLTTFEAEIAAHRGLPQPTFGIEPTEQLSEAARLVAPAAGLAESEDLSTTSIGDLVPDQVLALSSLAQEVIGAREMNEVLDIFCAKLSQLVPHCLCAITCIEPGSGENVVIHAAGQHWMFLKGRSIPSGEGVTGWVLANRKPFCNTDPRLDLPQALAGLSPAYRTMACFPIIKGPAIYGAVSVYSSVLTKYTAEHQKVLREAVSLLASALSVIEPATRENSLTFADDKIVGAIDPSLESELTH